MLWVLKQTSAIARTSRQRQGNCSWMHSGPFMAPTNKIITPLNFIFWVAVFFCFVKEGKASMVFQMKETSDFRPGRAVREDGAWHLHFSRGWSMSGMQGHASLPRVLRCWVAEWMGNGGVWRPDLCVAHCQVPQGLTGNKSRYAVLPKILTVAASRWRSGH